MQLPFVVLTLSSFSTSANTSSSVLICFFSRSTRTESFSSSSRRTSFLFLWCFRLRSAEISWSSHLSKIKSTLCRSSGRSKTDFCRARSGLIIYLPFISFCKGFHFRSSQNVVRVLPHWLVIDLPFRQTIGIPTMQNKQIYCTRELPGVALVNISNG